MIIQALSSRQLVFIILASFISMNSIAEEATGANLVARANDVAVMVRDSNANNFAEHFADKFLDQVSASKLSDIFSKLFRQVGSCHNARKVKSIRETAGTFIMECTLGFTVEYDIEIDHLKPHKIVGLVLKSATSTKVDSKNSLNIAVDRAKLLGTSLGFIVLDVSSEKTTVLGSANQDQAFEIGSVAKLYIASSLLNGIERRKLTWDQVVSLAGVDQSLPAGRLGTWPIGTPLTLQTLATLLIVDSDNTASDALLRTLNDSSSIDVAFPDTEDNYSEKPVFLSTKQYFTLRLYPEMVQAYRVATVAQRRKLLESLPRIDREELLNRFELVADSLSLVGWSASPQQVGNLLSRLANQLGRPHAKPMLQIFRLLASQDSSMPAGRLLVLKDGVDTGVLSYAMVVETDPGHAIGLFVVWNGKEREPSAEVQSAIHELISATQAKARVREPSS
jgi:Beta-lactamase enzyme family